MTASAPETDRQETGTLENGGEVTVLQGPDYPTEHLSLEEIVRPFRGTRLGLTVVDRQATTRLTYAKLAARAASTAYRLRRAGVTPGTPVAMTVNNGLDSITAVMGIWMAGGCVVSVPPPPRAAALQRYLDNFVPVLDAIGSPFFVSDGDSTDLPVPPGAKTLSLVELTAPDHERHAVPEAAIPDRALIQFTSGSIGAPKGVVLRGDQLAGHLAMITTHMELEVDRDRVVSWLPLYHDMGLVAMFLSGLASRAEMVIAAPSTFAGKPSSWLTTLSQARATITAAPNFAYRLAASVPYEEGLDLSRMRTALSGGERLHWQTLLDFHAVAGPLGFPWEAIRPSYGLAEGIVGSTSRPLFGGPTQGPGGHVSLGAPLGGVRLRAETGGEPAPIHLAGDWLFEGYQTAEGFVPRQGEWWDTGDAGFVHDGELYVLGRRDEVITLAGRNIFAEDVEAVGHDVGGPRVGACAVFRDSIDSGRFSMLAEVDHALVTSPDEATALARQIRSAVTDTLGTRLTSIRIVRRGTIPRTTSGKVQRAQCRALHSDGQLDRRTVAELT
ncbi:AMP-binding protein [Nonomuraea lactucae]|uniref:AMP-binding protein n=1 Tax=Nonomuraea lactucae TaxID=2249762 RepID=UPI000DE37AAE|nr:AMP-binding protein [Nonomuraea lactucae]